jgi:hypothetical protein
VVLAGWQHPPSNYENTGYWRWWTRARDRLGYATDIKREIADFLRAR